MHKGAREFGHSVFPYHNDRWVITAQFWPYYVPLRISVQKPNDGTIVSDFNTRFTGRSKRGVPSADREKMTWVMEHKDPIDAFVSYCEFSCEVVIGEHPIKSQKWRFRLSLFNPAAGIMIYDISSDTGAVQPFRPVICNPGDWFSYPVFHPSTGTTTLEAPNFTVGPCIWSLNPTGPDLP